MKVEAQWLDLNFKNMINYLEVIHQMSMWWWIATPLMRTSPRLRRDYYTLVMWIQIICQMTRSWIKILIKLITRIISIIILNNFSYLNLKQLTPTHLSLLQEEALNSVKEINRILHLKMVKATNLKKLCLEISWGVVNYAIINKFKIK